MTQIPKEFTELIGTTQKMGGCLFSRKNIDFKDYKVLDCRWGSAKIIDMETLKIKHPTVELLVKNEDMKASRWTRPFPCRSIELTDEEQ